MQEYLMEDNSAVDSVITEDLLEASRNKGALINMTIYFKLNNKRYFWWLIREDKG